MASQTRVVTKTDEFNVEERFTTVLQRVQKARDGEATDDKGFVVLDTGDGRVAFKYEDFAHALEIKG